MTRLSVLLCAGLLLCIAGGATVTATTTTTPPMKRELPEGGLILAYATQCETKVLTEAQRGVNVIIWFASNLVKNETSGLPEISFGRDIECIAQTASTLKKQNLTTTHLLSIGGWNAPHPSPEVASGKEWYQVFETFNQQIINQYSSKYDFYGFDGIDWDLEGNDNVSSPYNNFTVEGLQVVGEMSQALKANGYLVTLVPPQSYFDVETTNFDLSLLHNYPSYHPEFAYHGWNPYVALYQKYGPDNFDIVDIQLYETFSRAAEAIYGNGESPSLYLIGLVERLITGWTPQFSNVPSLNLPTQLVQIPASKIVLGMSTGLSIGRSVYIAPSDVQHAYEQLPQHMKFRGCMFWNINLDLTPANGTKTIVDFAGGYNKFLKARSSSDASN